MSKPLNIVQISDCHLFADISSQHCGADVYQNLIDALKHLKLNQELDLIIFTGDLTQDHSDGSYQRFVDAVQTCQIDLPFYYLPGNHDNVAKLDEYLVGLPFIDDKIINNKHWQVILLNSKSDNPSGHIPSSTWQQVKQTIDVNKHQLLIMHHHPIDVGYFIDRHGLTDQNEFWQNLNKFPSIKAIACGHVHQALNILPKSRQQTVPVYTCPATSIQFDANKDTVSDNGQGPGYRLFTLLETGELLTEAIFLKSENK